MHIHYTSGHQLDKSLLRDFLLTVEKSPLNALLTLGEEKEKGFSENGQEQLLSLYALLRGLGGKYFCP